MSDYSPHHWMKDIPDKPKIDIFENTIYGEPSIPVEKVRELCGYKEVKVSEIIECLKPELWRVDKMLIRNTIDALQIGIEHTRNNLTEHDSNLGRTTRKNKSWAETLESDIRSIEDCINKLKLVEVENSTHYP